MEFSFAADRKLVFFVQAGGLKRCVEFGDRSSAGASVFMTKDRKVANAIRKHPLSRRGVITETTPAEVIEESMRPSAPEPYNVRVSNGRKVTKAPAKVKDTPQEPVAGTDGKNVREYDNFSVAREAIAKEFGIPKKNLRTPTALDKVAGENGFTIRYKSADQQ